MVKYGVEFILDEEKEMLDAVFDTSKEAYKAGRKLLEEIKLQGRLKDLAYICIIDLHFKDGKLVDTVENKYIYEKINHPDEYLKINTKHL